MTKSVTFYIMRCFLLILIFAINIFITSTEPISSISRPNILFILIDDLGWNDIGFHGALDFETPNIDSLAKTYGLQLNNYYVESLCTPTRAALLSGRYPIKIGMQHLILYPNDIYGLPLHFTLLSQDLQKKAGYDTYLFGKWDLGYFNKKYTPNYRGFKTFYGYYNGMEDFFNHTVIAKYDGREYPRYDLRDNNDSVNDSMLHTYSTYIYGNKTLDVFRRYNENTDTEKSPLFIYLSLQNVHSPLQAPPDKIDFIKSTTIQNENRKLKAAKVVTVDTMIGDIVNELNETGLWDNTLIIFTTDNGAMYGDGGSNYPLRGTKGTLWEGGIKGTAFISGGYLHSSRYGQVTDELLHVTDWYPTICEIANITATDNGKLDGKSFLNIIQNETAKSHRTEILLNIDTIDCNNTFNVCGGIRINDWKLVIGDQDTKLPNTETTASNVCISGWCSNMDGNDCTGSTVKCNCDQEVSPETGCCNISKFINTCNGEPCLFNIKDDPCEFYDVKADNMDIFNMTINRLLFWKSKTVTPLNILNIAVDPANITENGYWIPWKNTSEINMWNTSSLPTTSPILISSATPTTSVPTSDPTLEPTLFPTNTPTMNTTSIPSTHSTVSPLVNTTFFSSVNPTISPSENPTMSPIMNTTISPSVHPTVSPSEHPTLNPSNTESPTMQPSNFSLEPTKTTLNPTNKPSTNTPTLNPTSSPSINPTVSPFINITSSSSENPTISPVESTTTSPSIASTLIPSNIPSMAPTKSPSAAGNVVTEVPSKGKNKYMTTFYLVSIFSIIGCGFLIFGAICYKRAKNRNKMRHRRLQDSLKGIELRPISQPQRGGGEYSGLLD